MRVNIHLHFTHRDKSSLKCVFYFQYNFSFLLTFMSWVSVFWRPATAVYFYPCALLYTTTCSPGIHPALKLTAESPSDVSSDSRRWWVLGFWRKRRRIICICVLLSPLPTLRMLRQQELKTPWLSQHHSLMGRKKWINSIKWSCGWSLKTASEA